MLVENDQAQGPTLSDRDAADQRAVDHEFSPVQRIERLEALAAQYFGTHHFETAQEVIFNPDAERESARKRFQQEMERIEAEARKGLNSSGVV